MKFEFERASVTLELSIIGKDENLFYRISSFRWGPLLVPVDKLRIKVVPEIGKSTNKVIVDVEFQKTSINQVTLFTGASCRSRTCHIRFRKPMLYPDELRTLIFGGRDASRTRTPFGRGF